MRIVAGRFKGREIVAPETRDVRPTSDRVRQSVFNILEHGIADFALQHARVLDLFAGSGALGLEALSRGASFAMFVETAAASRAAIRDNINRLALGGTTRLLKRDATDLGPVPKGDRFQLAFLDPPYAKNLADTALNALSEGSWLATNAIVLVEEHRKVTIPWPSGFDTIDQRTYGETTIHIARFTSGTRPIASGRSAGKCVPGWEQ